MAWALAGLLRAAASQQGPEDKTCKPPSSAYCPPSSLPLPVPPSPSSAPTPRRRSRRRA